jgi:hypothetical protein
MTDTNNAESTSIIQLLTRYSFDLGGYVIERLVEYWLHCYPASWIRLAIVEALYQGRYKAISVEQILSLWRRRGKPVYHFTPEFDRIICSRFSFSESTPAQPAPSIRDIPRPKPPAPPSRSDRQVPPPFLARPDRDTPKPAWTRPERQSQPITPISANFSRLPEPTPLPDPEPEVLGADFLPSELPPEFLPEVSPEFPLELHPPLEPVPSFETPAGSEMPAQADPQPEFSIVADPALDRSLSFQPDSPPDRSVVEFEATTAAYIEDDYSSEADLALFQKANGARVKKSRSPIHQFVPNAKPSDSFLRLKTVIQRSHPDHSKNGNGGNGAPK